MSIHEYQTSTALDRITNENMIQRIIDELFTKEDISNNTFFLNGNNREQVTAGGKTFRIDVTDVVTDRNIVGMYSPGTDLWMLQFQKNGAGRSETYANVIYPMMDQDPQFYKQIIYAIGRCLKTGNGAYILYP